MEVFKILGTIALNGVDQVNKDLDSTSGTAQKVASKIGDVCVKIGDGIVKAAKIGAAAIATVSTGIAALAKSAISEYADYEQLVGGVETLFKNSSDKIIEYANNAYKTAGLSANNYMETVTSFSASLLQSLDGDTAKAAEAADLAITDMADNANKMGTAIDSIQNAYQGFAKQNYTMLDNLKLGYGGTKEEMERLLEDAQELSGIKYDLSSFNDIVQAIHVVQTEMGITGTTAAEASTTIQGSISSMKSAWTNFLTGMADEEQDFDALVINVIDSVLTVANNLVPRIAETLPRLIQGLSQLMENLVPYIPKMLSKLVPSVINGATQLLNEVVQELPNILETLLPNIGGEIGETIVKMISSLRTLFKSMLPLLKQFASSILPAILKTVNSIFPVLTSITNKILPVISDALSEIAPVFLDFVEDLLPAFEDIITVVAEVLADLVPVITEIAEEIFPALSTVLNTVAELFSSIAPLVADLAETILPPLTVVLEGVSTAIGWICDGITGLLEGLGLRHDSLTQEQEDSRARREDAEKEAEQYREIKDAVIEAKDAAYEKAAADLEATAYTENLWKELQTLCDESGNVKDADKARAEFILNELNEALGTEYTLTGNQIQNYQDLQTEIDKTIEKKKAEILLTAAEENYQTAIENQTDAENARLEALKQVQEQQEIVSDYRQEQADLENELAELYSKNIEDMSMTDQYRITEIENRQEELKSILKDEQASLEEKKDAYSSAAETAQQYSESIAKYETAASLMLEEKTAEAIELLDGRGQAYLKAADIAGEATDEQMAQLEQQVIDAGIQYEILKQQMDDCAEYEKEYYKNELAAAQQHFDDMYIEYSNAGGTASKEFTDEINRYMTSYYGENGTATYHGTQLINKIIAGTLSEKSDLKDTLSDIIGGSLNEAGSFNWETAVSIGQNIVSGVSNGISAGKSGLLNAGKWMMNTLLGSAKDEGEIHSPSRRFKREIGKWIPEGVGEGVEDNVSAAVEPVENMIDDMVIVSRQTVGQAGTYRMMPETSSSANADVIEKLNELIIAIQAQRIYLDTGALVGGVAAEMNEALGTIAVSSERGR